MFAVRIIVLSHEDKYVQYFVLAGYFKYYEIIYNLNKTNNTNYFYKKRGE